MLLAFNVIVFIYVWRTLNRYLHGDASGEPPGTELGTVLLLTAHPDDEAMFFAPTLRALQRDERSVHILCLSRGREEGAVREKELKASCKALGVASHEVGSFVDGPEQEWKPQDVAQRIEATVKALGKVRSILTFDEGGVSGHPNHIACARGVQHWRQQGQRTCNVLCLHSTWLPWKYGGLLQALLSVVVLPHDVFFLSLEPLLVWRLMRTCYTSQFTWYRRLYCLASRYVYLNDYVLLQ